jgi:hypothetical protein
MPKRSSKPKRSRDINELAPQIVNEATREQEPEHPQPAPEREKNQAAVELGRLGGLKGGRARAKKLTPERRSEIAKRAAESRWEKQRP